MSVDKLGKLFERLRLHNLHEDLDLNSKEQLETLKELSELLKLMSKTSQKLEGLNTFNLLEFLVKYLHKTSNRDVSRKLVIRCFNLITLSPTDEQRDFVTKEFRKFLHEPLSHVLIGQKLFVLNIYLENLDVFGLSIIKEIRDECLEFFVRSSLNHNEEFKNTVAPIELFNTSQNIQWTLKTFILFSQKCFSASDMDTAKIKSRFEAIETCAYDLLQIKEAYNMEVCISAAMVYILINNFHFKNELKEILNKMNLNEGDISPKKLAVYQAILTMMKANELLKPNSLSVFKHILIECIETPINSTQVVQIARIYNYWSIKLIELLNNDQENVNNNIGNESCFLISKLIVTTWSQFESNIDVVRNLSYQTYRSAIEALVKLNDKCNFDQVIDAELKRCLQMSWQSTAKYNVLTTLLDNGVNITQLLQMSRNIADELIESINERSSACAVADLYLKLFIAHRDECKENIAKWASFWWIPLVKAIESDNKNRKLYIYEYLLPRLLKQYPDGINYCQSFSKSRSTIVSCAKLSRSLALNSNEPQSSKTIFNNIPLEVLKNTIVSSDEQTRLDSLGLICENPKTTELINDIEFELCKLFLYYNIDNSSPSYRQSILASIKKLLIRLKESWQFQCRSVTKAKYDENQIKKLHEVNKIYKDFLDWLIEFALYSIHLDGTFAKRNQSLLILNLIIDTLGPKCEDAKQSLILFDVQEMWNCKRLNTLIECLWDTYVVNKNTVLNLLLKIDVKTFKQNNFELSKNYFQTALDLLASRKPSDSLTSVYLVAFLKEKTFLPDYSALVGTLTHYENSKSIGLFLVKCVVSEFRKHCEKARANLLLAALNTPVYGPLSAVRNLISQSISEMNEDELLSDWQRLIEEVIELCLQVSLEVSPIVSSNSPEGIFPMELVQLQEASGDEVKNVTPQMLLVCCWRTMKEISLLFGELVQKLSLQHESPKYVLTQERVFLIGDYFVKHLLSTRHRGAFELAYVGFTNMCETFWRCKSKVYCEMPEKWLDYVINLIQSEESREKICSTRRGGGMPFFVQAIVSTELTENGHLLIEKCMKTLISLTSDSVIESNDVQNYSKVLSMYVISALFKDTRIGEEVFKYAEDALIVAINGLESPYWNVRNASTILFSSLMNRVFGVNRSRDEISKKNSMPAKIFFTKFPKLYQYFESVLSESTKQLSSNLNSKLYLVLLILCRLYTLSDEKSDSEAVLHNYIPYLLKCTASPVMKIREFNGKALATIVNMEREPGFMQMVCKNLTQKWLRRDDKLFIDFNSVNGLLEVLNCVIDKHCASIHVEYLVDNLKEFSFMAHNECLMNYASLMSLLIKLMNLCGSPPEKINTIDDNNNVSCHEKILEQMHEIANYLTEMLINRLAKNPSWNAPGIDTMLVFYAEMSMCIEYNERSVYGFKRLIDDYLQQKKYKLNILDGTAKFLHKLIKQKPEIAKLKRIRTQTNSYFREGLYEVLLKSDAPKCSSQILAKSCDLFSLLIQITAIDTTSSQYETVLPNDENELIKLWQAILGASCNQTESETRLSIINLLSNLCFYVQPILQKSTKERNAIVKTLNDYIDKNGDLDEIASLLKQNIHLFHMRDDMGKLVKDCMNFWSLLFEILLDVDSNANKIGTQIVSQLCLAHQTSSSEIRDVNAFDCEYEASAALKVSLEIFVRLFFSEFTNECVEFLFSQLEKITSECEIESFDDEDDSEQVFEKVVDSVHTITLQYALALCNTIKSLYTNRLSEHENRALFDLLNAKYGDAEKRMRETLNGVLEANCNVKTCYSSLACNRTLIEKLYPIVAKSNQVKYAEAKEMLYLNNHRKLTCFIQSDINQLFDFIS